MGVCAVSSDTGAAVSSNAPSQLLPHIVGEFYRVFFFSPAKLEWMI